MEINMSSVLTIIECSWPKKKKKKPMKVRTPGIVIKPKKKRHEGASCKNMIPYGIRKKKNNKNSKKHQ